MKSVFYEDGNTMVCLLLDEKTKEVLSRGISIRSRVETINDVEKWEKQAQSRAMEAIGRRNDCSPIKLDAPRASKFDVISLSLAADRFGAFKGYYKPTITNTERILLNKKRLT